MRSGGLPPWTAVRNCWSLRPPSAHFRVTSGYCDLKSLIRLVAMSSPFVQSKPITFSSPDAWIAGAPADCDPPPPDAAGEPPPPPDDPAGLGVLPLLHAVTASRSARRPAPPRARRSAIDPPPRRRLWPASLARATEDDDRLPSTAFPAIARHRCRAGRRTVGASVLRTIATRREGVRARYGSMTTTDVGEAQRCVDAQPRYRAAARSRAGQRARRSGRRGSRSRAPARRGRA